MIEYLKRARLLGFALGLAVGPVLGFVLVTLPLPALATGKEDLKFAKVLLGEGEWAAAMNFFGLAIDDGALTTRQLSVAYHLRGVSRSKLNKHRLAQRDHKKAVLLDPNYVEAWSSLCYQHGAHSKQFDVAMKACNKALVLDPKHAPSYALRAVVWHGLAQIDRAEVDFTQAITLAPKNWGIHFNRGMFYHNIQEPVKAKSSFVKAYQLASNWERHGITADPVFKAYGVSK